MNPGTFSLALLLAAAAPVTRAPHWTFEHDLAAGRHGALAGAAGAFEKGAPPLFDPATPAPQIWDGGTFTLVTPDNRRSLRFVNDAVAGAGNPVGGDVTIPSMDPRTRPEGLTIEAFVKMHRQMPRHALIASKRRNGQTGATWSLSIDPAGRLRARLDTQPGAAGGPGFNQSFGSSGALDDCAWHHVALTFDPATRSVALFLDHARCGGGITGGPLVYDDGPLILGRGLDGWLDEVRLTPEPLHPEQFLRSRRFFSELKPRAPSAPMLDQTPTRVQTALRPAWPRIGTLTPRGVSEIATPMWSLGCETLDRDLADWDAYREYLRPLGIRRIRLQGGWNRTETKRGEYDFAWLDRIVDDALALGLEICLETSYNNRLYEPAGALGPGGRLPRGEETLAAWDRWLEAMARRYSARGVKEWMMYNEPNLNKENTPELIVANNVRTAEIIRRVDPEAKIGAFVLAGLRTDAIRAMLERIKAQGKLHLFTWAIYHGYSANPDRLNPEMQRFNAMLAEVAPGIRPWQGEAGCASEEVQYALSGIDWTEYSHAKWNARRMLCDLGHGIDSSVFTISDVSYHKDFLSRYGLLKTAPDNSIIRVKTAYYTVQNVVSLFNDALERDPDTTLTVAGTDKDLTRFAFRDRKTGLGAVALWDGAEIPSNASDLATVQLRVAGARFQEPVWVDLVTGNIHAIPPDHVSADGGTTAFRDVPVYDAPCAIVDRALLTFVPARAKEPSATSPAPRKRAAPKTAPPPMRPHLLPGTQQPAPAILICAGRDGDADALATWLGAREIHAFVLEGDATDARRALQTIRERAAEWQVRPGALGILGAGERGAQIAAEIAGEADFAVFLAPANPDVARRIPEPGRATTFVGERAAPDKPLAEWLEKFKGKVF